MGGLGRKKDYVYGFEITPERRMPANKQKGMVCAPVCCSPKRISQHADEAVILCFLCIDGEDLVIILTQLAQHTAITEEWPLKTKSLVQQRDTDTLTTDPLEHEHERVSRNSAFSLVVCSLEWSHLFCTHSYSLGILYYMCCSENSCLCKHTGNGWFGRILLIPIPQSSPTALAGWHE